MAFSLDTYNTRILKEQKFDFKDFEAFVDFETNNKYFTRILNGFVSLLTSNDPKIVFHDLFKGNKFLESEENLEVIRKVVLRILPTVLMKINTYGFVSYRPEDEYGAGIRFIDYNNVDLKYSVDRKQQRMKIHTYWKTPGEDVFSSSNVYFRKLQRFIDMNYGYKDEDDGEDKTVKHYVAYPPTFKGRIVSPFTPFVHSYLKIKRLEQYQILTEKDKVSKPYYVQKKPPDLRPDNFEALQYYTFLKNANPNELDDPRKRFMNIHGVRRHIEFFEPDWKKRTTELVTKFFRMNKMHEVELDRRTGKIRSVGELAELKFLPITESSSLLEELKKEFRELSMEWFGIFQTGTQQKLKDQARLTGFFVNANKSKHQLVLEDALSYILTEMANSMMDHFAKKKIAELRMRNRELPKDSPERVPIPDPEVLKLIKVELNPLVYLNTDELEMIARYNPSLKDFIRLAFGDKLVDFIPGSDKMYQQISVPSSAAKGVGQAKPIETAGREAPKNGGNSSGKAKKGDKKAKEKKKEKKK
jgi:hypothetical protein